MLASTHRWRAGRSLTAPAWVGLGLLGGLLLGAVGARLGLAPPALISPVPSYTAAYATISPSVVVLEIDGPEARVGAGFAISAGEIVTARHLVVGADAIRVRDQDGVERVGRLIGEDARTDLALVGVDGVALAPAPLGRAASLKVGETVLTVGNPYGLGASLSVGVLSGVQRRLASGEGPTGDFLQLAVPLNPGNSGGPVVDGRGRVVGVLTGTHTRGQGIAFAVPIESLLAGLEDLRAGRLVTRAWLGLRVEQVGESVVVAQLAPASPAAEAGLRVGDVLTAVDGAPVRSSGDLSQALDGRAGGERASLRLLRDGQLEVVDVTLADWASQPVVVAGLTLRASPGSGGVVVAVRPASRADEAGVKVGDVVRTVDGIPMRAPADVKGSLSHPRGAQLELLRLGQAVLVSLPPLS